MIKSELNRSSIEIDISTIVDNEVFSLFVDEFNGFHSISRRIAKDRSSLAPLITNFSLRGAAFMPFWSNLLLEIISYR